MSSLELKVHDLFKARFSEDEARAVIELFDVKAEQKYQEKKDVLLTKEDKIDIMRAIYATQLVQFLATVGSMIAIFHFMLSK